MKDFSILESPAGEEIAWINDGARPRGDGPCGFFWLGGYMSDMAGSKASMLGELARLTNRSAVRFDYSGHGESGGDFTAGTIGKWLGEAEAMFRQVARGPRILIGSSMGGWLAMLLARRLLRQDAREAARIRGMILLAPAADMTEDLMWAQFPDEAREKIRQEGVLHVPSGYGDVPYPITLDLIEEGRSHLILEEGLDAPFPVRILQGEEDRDVPWEHGLKTYRAISGDDVTFTLIKGADHRLSAPGELQLLQEVLLALCARADAPAA